MVGNINWWWIARISLSHLNGNSIGMKYLSWYHLDAQDINEGVIELNADNLISWHLFLICLVSRIFSFFLSFFSHSSRPFRCVNPDICVYISIIVKWCVFIRNIKHLKQVIALMCTLLFIALFWICLDERVRARLVALCTHWLHYNIHSCAQTHYK